MQVNKLKLELDNLRESLKNWQGKLTYKESEIIEKIVEVPVEVIKYVERPIEVFKVDDTKSRELQNQINEIYTAIDIWRDKYESYNDDKDNNLMHPGRHHHHHISNNEVDVANMHEVVEDERIVKYKQQIEQLQKELETWEHSYRDIKSQEIDVVEQVVEVKVPVTKYIEHEVHQIIRDEAKINELRDKISDLYKILNDGEAQDYNSAVNNIAMQNVNNISVNVKSNLGMPKSNKSNECKQKVIEKIIEVPVEVVEYVTREVQKVVIDEKRVKELTEELNQLHQTLSDWEKKCENIANIETNSNNTIITEHVIEVPVEVIKYHDKVVYVDEVDQTRLNRVQEDYNKLQATIEEWKQKYEKLCKKETKIIEKIVEQPIEVIKYIDKPYETLHYDEKRINELSDEYDNLQDELAAIKKQIQIQSTKPKTSVERIIEVPVEKTEYIDHIVEVPDVDEVYLNYLQNDCDELTKTLDGLMSKYEDLSNHKSEIQIVTRDIEVPVDVIEYIDKPKEIKHPDEGLIRALEDEHKLVSNEIKRVRNRIRELEKTKNETKTQVIEIEVPVEKIEYVDKIVEVVKVDENKLRRHEREYNELCVTLNNWKAKYEAAIQKKQ